MSHHIHEWTFNFQAVIYTTRGGIFCQVEYLLSRDICLHLKPITKYFETTLCILEFRFCILYSRGTTFFELAVYVIMGRRNLFEMGAVRSAHDQWRCQPDILVMQMQIFLCLYRPYKEPISEEINNNNHLNCICMNKCLAGFATARDLLRWFGGSEFW